MKGEQSGRRFVCDFPGCKKIFNRRDYLERHAHNHLDVKPFVCEKCNRHFSRRDLYENHLSTKFHARHVQNALVDEDQASMPAQTTNLASHKDPIYKHKQPSQPNSGPDAADKSVPNYPPQNYPPPKTSGVYYSSAGGLGEALSQPEIKQPFGYEQPSLDFMIPSNQNNANAFYPMYHSIDNMLEFYRPLKRASTDLCESGVSPKLVRTEETGCRPPSTGTDVCSAKSAVSGFSSPGSNASLEPFQVASSPWQSAQFPSAERANGSHANIVRLNLMQTRAMLEQRLAQEAETAPYKNLREPTTYQKDHFDEDQDDLPEDLKINSEYDDRFEWFFNDKFTTSSEKYGYDIIYMNSFKTANKQRAAYLEEHPPQKPVHVPVNPYLANLLLSVLQDASVHIQLTIELVEHFINLAWEKLPMVSHLVHRATFDPNNTHPALSTVLVMFGMAMSKSETHKCAAKAVYPSVFLYAYESLEQPEGAMSTCYAATYVGHLQALCIIACYEAQVLGSSALPECSLIRLPHLMDKLIWHSLQSVPHLSLVPNANTPPVVCTRELLWAKSTFERHIFHQGAYSELQWREWAALEMCRRTAHLFVHCDSRINLLSLGKKVPLVSILYMDIHMTTPDAFWLASSCKEFFAITPPEGYIINTPFLGFVKSLLRFPRVYGVGESREGVPRHFQCVAPFPAAMMRLIAHALLSIGNRMCDVAKREDLLLDCLLNKKSVWPEVAGISMFSPEAARRFHRGLDIWCRQYEVCVGDLPERLVKFTESMLHPDRPGPGWIGLNEGTPEYAIILMLSNYASFLFVHEDLPVVLQASNNISKWLEGERRDTPQGCFDYLYMPLYVEWLQGEDGGSIFTASCKFLTWATAACGEFSLKSWGQMVYLPDIIYMCVIVVWLKDLTTKFVENDGELPDMTVSEEDLLPNCKFLYTANQFFRRVDESGGYLEPGEHLEVDAAAVQSVILLGVCLLDRRSVGRPLAKLLISMIYVRDISRNELMRRATEQFRARIHARFAQISKNVDGILFLGDQSE